MAETVRLGVEIDIIGIDNSVRSTQRLLYFMNAIRLSIVDFQRLIKDPSIENLFWTGIQLTQVYTNLIRLIKQANRAAAGGGAATLLGLGVGGGGGGGVGNWQRGLKGRMEDAFGGTAGARIWGGGGAATSSLWSTVTAFAAGIGPPGWIALGVLAVAGGWLVWDVHQKSLYNDWQQRQREIAKSQGLEY